MFNKKLYRYIFLISFLISQISTQAQNNCGSASINSSRVRVLVRRIIKSTK